MGGVGQDASRLLVEIVAVELRGPRRLDPDQEQKVMPNTQDEYRRAAHTFVAWLDSEGFEPDQPQEWDDLAVEFKNEKQLSPAMFAASIASIGYFPTVQTSSSLESCSCHRKTYTTLSQTYSTP